MANQHVVPNGGDWAVRGEGNSRLTAIVDNKSEAIRIARDIAINQMAELVIHNSHGIIIDRDSYGRDPNPPKDTKY
jgi:hypothetical protein